MSTASVPSAAINAPSVARRAVLAAGLACGVLDILAAIAAASLNHGTAVGVLQAVASGLLGRHAFAGGAATAALGLLLHFAFAFGWAALFYALVRKFPALIRNLPAAALAGLAYGACVYAAMYWGVIPAAAIVRKLYLADVVVRFPPFALQALVIHFLFVGLPIALVVYRFAKTADPHSATEHGRPHP